MSSIMNIRLMRLPQTEGHIRSINKQDNRLSIVCTYENRKKAVFIRAFSSKKASGRLCARIILRKKLFSYVHFALTEAKTAKMHI